jgi:hypothetical protein
LNGVMHQFKSIYPRQEIKDTLPRSMDHPENHPYSFFYLAVTLRAFEVCIVV